MERAAGDADAPLRAVVCSAGGFAGGQPVAETPVEAFEAQFALNLRTAYLTIQAALPRLAAAGGGAIVCVGSRAGQHPFAGAAGYCTSKAALHALAEVVAREHRDDGIRCNVGRAGHDRHAGEPRRRDAAAACRPPRSRGSSASCASDEAAATTGATVPVYPP